MKEITVSLNTRSINAAIKQLNNYRTNQQRNLEQAMRRIAEAIAELAREYYAEAKLPEQYYPGWEEQPRVDVEKISNGYEVIAEGKQIGFLEFGTGAFSDSQHPYSGEVTFPVFPGSYSDTVGAGSYLRWVNAHGTDEEYPYNREPTRALYKAVNDMRPKIEDIIRKELNKNGKP